MNLDVFLQGLLERSILFDFACRVAKYEVEQKDVRKCMNSFFSYARQLQTLREGIKTDEQKEIFDMEVNLVIRFMIIEENY